MVFPILARKVTRNENSFIGCHFETKHFLIVPTDYVNGLPPAISSQGVEDQQARLQFNNVSEGHEWEGDKLVVEESKI